MSEFKREGRYIVVKPDCEDSLRTERLRNYIDEMCFHTPDCVVIEADWPEYEPVWRMIERRVTGDSSNERPVEVLGYSVVGNRYAIRLTKGEVLELSENYADHLIELVDRKHLTDAQVELAALREELATAKRVGPPHFCGLPMSLNPHPEAGIPGRFLEVGTVSECIPCLVSSRHGWAKTAGDLQQRLAAAEQRNAELVRLLHESKEIHAGFASDIVAERRYQILPGWLADAERHMQYMTGKIDAALKPTESGASE